MWSHSIIATLAVAASHPMTPGTPPQLDRLMLFGFLAAFGTAVCTIYQKQSRPLQLLLSICLAALAIYGFLAGAWPTGIIAFGASLMVVFRFWFESMVGDGKRRVTRQHSATRHPVSAASGSRLIQLFGEPDMNASIEPMQRSGNRNRASNEN